MTGALVLAAVLATAPTPPVRPTWAEEVAKCKAECEAKGQVMVGCSPRVGCVCGPKAPAKP